MNTRYSALFSKQGLVTTQLAWDLLQYQPGDQIARAQDYARKYGVGAGTVQAALQQLFNADVVKVEARGRWGTFIQEIDYPGLWQFTVRGPVVGSMPLPYSPLYEGLATGLHEVFREATVLLNLTFVRGSLNRLEAMAHERCDFAVVSRLAFNKMQEDGHNVTLAKSMGPGTWIENHVLVFRDASFSKIQPGMRVGIDNQSIDHAALVHGACAEQDVEFVDIGYMQIRSALDTGQIDATVWNVDDFTLRPAPSFKIVLPQEVGFGDLYNIYSEAVIIVTQDQWELVNLLKSIIDIEAFLTVQADVVARKRLPSY